MSKIKIGRNDPCSCGSGKKYKNCCQAKDEDAGEDLFTRYNQAISSVKLKLDQEFKAEIRKIRKSAQQSFIFYATNKQLPAEHETLFSDWLWFDMVDSEDNTLAKEYLGKHAHFMPDLAKESLSALSESYLSVYEPVSYGQGFILLRNIFSNTLEQVIIKESLEDDFREKSLLLLGRLAALPEGKVFSGMVLALENTGKEADCFINHMKYMQELTNENDATIVLKQRADLLYGLFDRIYHKILFPINDVRMIKLPEDKNMDSIRTLMDASDQFQFVHQLEDLSWYKPINDQQFQRIALGEDYLISCINNLENLDDSWKDILGDSFPPLNSWQIISTRLLQQVPPPELKDIWLKVLWDQETEHWLNTPHVELDNTTPLAKLTEEHGAEEIIKMLDQFSSSLNEGQEGLALIGYMRHRILALQTNC